jgi:uncharacterized protein (DUF983 family)
VVKGTDISSSQGDSADMPALAFDALPGFWSLLARGLTRRCAWCGDRKAYFNGWFRRQDACRVCRHGWRRGDEAFELGATTANIILTFLTILISILVAVVVTWPEVPTAVLIVIIGSLAVLGPALWYPVSFTLWQAIDLFMRRPEPNELAGRGDADL